MIFESGDSATFGLDTETEDDDLLSHLLQLGEATLQSEVAGAEISEKALIEQLRHAKEVRSVFTGMVAVCGVLC